MIVAWIRLEKTGALQHEMTLGAESSHQTGNTTLCGCVSNHSVVLGMIQINIVTF